MKHKSPASVIVEVLTLLFIVGLLAAVAIPDFDDQKPEVRLRALITSLETVRTAIDRTWSDHNAVYSSLEEINALEKPDRSFGFRAGLAIHLDKMPDNPFTNGNHVGRTTDPVGTSDWVYDPTTGVFKANDNEQHRAL